MRFFRSIQFILLLVMLGITTAYSGENTSQPLNKSSVIIQLEIDGVIGPATADYIQRNLHKAIASEAVAVLIKMDTPGGLDTSMRQIIKQIISSPIPIISYVSPGGARAASAGTYILYASH
ncbi:MAG: nodulation protein NfeD, partial [Methyloprofundus sp.]|nr:nodulation protein NfeD [Methyloprofundus sp.]